MCTNISSCVAADDPVLQNGAVAGKDPDGVARNEGLLEGLEDPDGPVVWPDLLAEDDTGPEAMRRAGVLSGRIWAATMARGAPADDRALLAALAYGAALSSPAAQRALRPVRADGALKAHVYACALGERHGHRYSDEDERWLFGWLCERLQVAVTSHLDARLLRLRTRRLERTLRTRPSSGE